MALLPLFYTVEDIYCHQFRIPSGMSCVPDDLFDSFHVFWSECERDAGIVFRCVSMLDVSCHRSRDCTTNNASLWRRMEVEMER